jgi:hypothetical protein
MVTLKGRRGWSGKPSRESLIAMGWLPTGQTIINLFSFLVGLGFELSIINLHDLFLQIYQ